MSNTHSGTELMPPQWWGESRVPEGRCAHWRVGPLTLWVIRRSREWLVAWDYTTDAPEIEPVVVHEQCELPDSALINRFALRRLGDAVSLLPLLADRPVISRPEQPLWLPSGEEATIYLSSPLWLALHAGEPQRLLCEVPVSRPSDSWFGSPILPGGLAYAAPTRANTSFEGYTFSPFHALTPLLIRNNARSALLIERINLPVPYLALYRTEAGSWWTQAVTLEHDQEGGELALLRLNKGLPPEAGRAELISEPRRDTEKNLVFQAFSKLFT